MRSWFSLSKLTTLSKSRGILRRVHAWDMRYRCHGSTVGRTPGWRTHAERHVSGHAEWHVGRDMRVHMPRDAGHVPRGCRVGHVAHHRGRHHGVRRRSPVKRGFVVDLRLTAQNRVQESNALLPGNGRVLLAQVLRNVAAGLLHLLGSRKVRHLVRSVQVEDLASAARRQLRRNGSHAGGSGGSCRSMVEVSPEHKLGGLVVLASQGE